MPVNVPLRTVAQELIDAHAGIEAARQRAEYAKTDAADAERSQLPDEVKEAYRVIAEEAQAEILHAERAYQMAKEAFMAARQRARS